jgi:hypothetical protein
MKNHEPHSMAWPKHAKKLAQNWMIGENQWISCIEISGQANPILRSPIKRPLEKIPQNEIGSC